LAIPPPPTFPLFPYTTLFRSDGQGSNFDPSLYNAANAPVLFLPFCTSALTSAACPNANRRALNPATGALSTNTNLVGTFVPGTGDRKSTRLNSSHVEISYAVF